VDQGKDAESQKSREDGSKHCHLNGIAEDS
jgi:hypothetical protein